MLVNGLHEARKYGLCARFLLNDQMYRDGAGLTSPRFVHPARWGRVSPSGSPRSAGSGAAPQGKIMRNGAQICALLQAR
jgi:hypothetical protein